MNPKYFGDSYDIVKRFLCAELMALGYSVIAEPMFTGEWSGTESAFLRFIGASLPLVDSMPSQRTALFFDPDTGVHRNSSRQHVSLTQLVEDASKHGLVFAFDQSFSRQHDSEVAMHEKLTYLREQGCHAMYYNSHARFLFVATEEAQLAELRAHLISLGLPSWRFVESGT